MSMNVKLKLIIIIKPKFRNHFMQIYKSSVQRHLVEYIQCGWRSLKESPGTSITYSTLRHLFESRMQFEHLLVFPIRQTNRV